MARRLRPPSPPPSRPVLPPAPDPAYPRAVTLVWCAPDGATYPDEVQRAAQHALDLAVMRGAVLTHEVTDTTVRVVAVRVQVFKGALVALLGAPTC